MVVSWHDGYVSPNWLRASRSQGAANRQVRCRAVGGRLFVTNERLILEPNAVDRRSGGGRWACRLGSIRSEEVDRRSDTFWEPLLKVRPRVFVSTESEEKRSWSIEHETWARRFGAPQTPLTSRRRVGRKPSQGDPVRRDWGLS